MSTYSISKTFAWDGAISDKVASVMRMFGVTVKRLREADTNVKCKLRIEDGDIVYITGPSGAGKSVLLRELERCVPDSDKVNLAEVKLSGDKTVIECMDGDFLEGLRLLSIAGLSDVFCVLNKPVNLSDGQKYRFRLAKALTAKKRFIFADEFCSNLDRITAAVISYNIHRFAKRCGVTFILASSHEDILGDLSPDVLVVKELSGGAEVTYKKVKS